MKKTAQIVLGLFLLGFGSFLYAQTLCTMEYDPVCGTDGKTYSNRCVAIEQNGVNIAYRGVCNAKELGDEQAQVPNTNQAIPDHCIMWFDGCNECSLVDSQLQACTKRDCEKNIASRCIEYEFQVLTKEQQNIILQKMGKWTSQQEEDHLHAVYLKTKFVINRKMRNGFPNNSWYGNIEGEVYVFVLSHIEVLLWGMEELISINDKIEFFFIGKQSPTYNFSN